MNRIVIILISIFGVASYTSAQTLRQYKKAALEAYNQKDYYAALVNYQTVLNVDSSDLVDFYNHAESARHFNAYQLAENSYQHVLDSENQEKYPLTAYWLAGIKKQLGKYDEARQLYQSFVTNVSDVDNLYVQNAQRELAHLTWAQEMINAPDTSLKVEHLGPEINTDYSEVNPFIVDSVLYYSSFRFENPKDNHYPPRPLAKILRSDRGQVGKLLPDSINLEFKHTANIAFNSTKTRVYYTICEYGDGYQIPCQIYYRNKLTEDNWSEAICLPDYINIAGCTSTHPNVAYDEAEGKEILYFVSNRPDGIGELDIWYSEIAENGTFAQPKNLEAINTPYNDITPFYHTNSATLYFSSQGRDNLGGYDIYKVAKDKTIWKNVQHLDAPINSSYNDVYYILNDEHTKAYFSSNRLESYSLEPGCCNDIYTLDIEPIIINLLAETYDKNTREPLWGVEVELLELSEVLEKDSHLSDHEYSFSAQVDKEYAIIAKKIGYEPDTVYVSTMGLTKSEDILSKLYLKPFTIDLIGLTFDAEKGTPLLGTRIQLYDCEGNLIGDVSCTTSNDALFQKLSPNSCYELIGSKPNYKSDTLRFTTAELLTNSITIEKRLNLLPEISEITLINYLPMHLYFDNDRPNPRTMRVKTDKTYEETVKTYIARRETFRNMYSRGSSGEEKIKKQTEIDMFFDEYVIKGADTLKAFTGYLIQYLEQGNTAQLMIRGFASPLAGKRYNNNLTKRRINSIVNYFNEHDRGAMRKFLNSGQLKVSEVSYGEYLAQKGISDDVKDRKNSVFSPAASIERRVEIIEIKINQR